VSRGWRPVLAAYVIVMALTLVYTAEHFVIDILLGWALAAVVMFAMEWFTSRRARPPAEEADISPSAAAIS
jgi:predicted PurR-regulated permease PerM